MTNFNRGFRSAIDRAAHACLEIAAKQATTLPEEKYRYVARAKKLVAEQCVEAVRKLRKEMGEISQSTQKIGELRPSLLLPYSCKWNGVVREVTARHEQSGESTPILPVYRELLQMIRTSAALDKQFPPQYRLLELFSADGEAVESQQQDGTKNCPYCGPECYGGAEHNARVENGDMYLRKETGDMRSNRFELCCHDILKHDCETCREPQQQGDVIGQMLTAWSTARGLDPSGKWRDQIVCMTAAAKVCTDERDKYWRGKIEEALGPVTDVEVEGAWYKQGTLYRNEMRKIIDKFLTNRRARLLPEGTRTPEERVVVKKTDENLMCPWVVIKDENLECGFDRQHMAEALRLGLIAQIRMEEGQ